MDAAVVPQRRAHGFPLEQWYWEMPVCTRLWTTSTIITAVLVQADIVAPLRLFYTYNAVFRKQQFWRLFTTFIYFGPLSLELIFQMFFLARYAKLLETQSPSTAHFSWLMLLICSALLLVSTYLNVPFLGHPLSSTLTYIWSRRNPDVRLSFLGLLVFSAPYLPLVLMGFSFVMHGIIPKDEIIGAAIGYIVYYFDTLHPALSNGSRPLDPPRWWKALFEGWPARGDDGDATAVNVPPTPDRVQADVAPLAG